MNKEISHISPFDTMGFGKQNHTEGRQEMTQLHINVDEASLISLMLGNLKDFLLTTLLQPEKRESGGTIFQIFRTTCQTWIFVY